MWYVQILLEAFDGSNIERAESIESKKDYSCFLSLYRASLSGDWKKAEAFFIREKEARRAQINSLTDSTPCSSWAEYGYVSVDVFAYFLHVTTDLASYTGLNGVRLLNRLIHLDLYVPALKHIRDKKSIHHNAVKFAECLFEKIETLNDKEVDSIVSRPLLDAARYGAYELVEIIIRRFPSLAYFYDRDEKNIFHTAIENRCEDVFNLVCQMSQLRHQLMISKDSSGNTMLHLAGKLAPQNKLNLVSGPALQMQRELQWFKVI
ncbi:hypothetical protein K7X08_026371 [Anisodus acutangulus]|uniref:Uncharacterized protein n=1 Tax=Anisodus acutangulus TaxID=402998 RepID=A0A9Q1LQN4_9SOLA|nr:hypothetical protein K7X08_026371 [Anisodus acutangulus]